MSFLLRELRFDNSDALPDLIDLLEAEDDCNEQYELRDRHSVDGPYLHNNVP
jgi:hypothetical protein